MAKITASVTVREAGEANTYTIMKDGNWLMSVLHNGEATLEQQREHMRLIAAAIEGAAK